LLNKLIKPNPYLTYLTGESNPDWFWGLSLGCFYLWMMSSFLILISPEIPALNIIAILGLPLGLPMIIILIVVFLFLATRLAFAESQKNLFSLLLLTNLPLDAIFWSLILVAVHRTRKWFPLLIGIFPFLVWSACQGYIFFAQTSDLRFVVSLLGHSYMYEDGPTLSSRLLEIFWFLSITIGVLGVIASALFGCVSITLRGKNTLADTLIILLLTVALALAIVLIVAPEGFLLIDTHYQWDLIIWQVLYSAVLVAALPCVAAFALQYLVRRWTLNNRVIP
jgi:hypothetical protein